MVSRKEHEHAKAVAFDLLKTVAELISLAMQLAEDDLDKAQRRELRRKLFALKMRMAMESEKRQSRFL